MGAPGLAEEAAMELVRGFRLLRLPMGAGSPVSRSVLVKRHEERDATEKDGAGRTLFVTHLDNLVTEGQLSRCFTSGFGPVEKVVLKSVEKRAPRAEQRADHVKGHVNFARVIFKDRKDLEKALGAANGKIVGSAVLSAPAGQLRECLKASHSVYRDPVELRTEIDTWMASHDAREEEKKRLARETQVDDDGFTKVVSGITRTTDGNGDPMAIRAAKRPALKTGAFAEPLAGNQQEAALPAGERKKMKKPREQLDFYRFQLREKKRAEVNDHRKRKVEDFEKVERMKKTKRFKMAKAP